MPPVGPRHSVYVRPARTGDAPFLVDVVLVATRAQGRIESGFDEGAWREGFLEETQAQIAGAVEHSTTYVVEIGGERAGRMRVVRAPGLIELAGLQLLPAHQGAGIGTHLVEQLLAESRREGSRMRLGVERDNPRARALYERLGFREVDRDELEVHLEWRPPVNDGVG